MIGGTHLRLLCYCDLLMQMLEELSSVQSQNFLIVPIPTRDRLRFHKDFYDIKPEQFPLRNHPALYLELTTGFLFAYYAVLLLRPLGVTSPI